LEKLDAECGARLLIVTMNVQENYQIPAELEISSLPVLALYRKGQFERFIGGLGKKDAIREQLPPL
jgi:thioredoxin-like negative regulator of GroEL